MGDHVKVIAGRYEGDTGLIVRVEENFVILFSDLTMHEVPETKERERDSDRMNSQNKASEHMSPAEGCLNCRIASLCSLLCTCLSNAYRKMCDTVLSVCQNFVHVLV